MSNDNRRNTERTAVRVGLVGYGYWGPNLLRNLIAHGKFEVVGVVDPRAEARLGCQRTYPSLPVFERIEDFLQAARPEAVVITTPPLTHRDMAVRALESGAHVLVEKPFAMSVSECDEILAAAAKRNLRVMVDHTFAFHPAVDFIAREQEAGRLGKLLYFDSVRANFGGYQAGADVLWDLAPHDLSILDRLLGGQLPLTVSAIGIRLENSLVDSVCQVTLQYPSGFLAHLHLSWVAPIKLRTILLGGTERMIVYDDNLPTEKVKVYDKRLVLPSTPNNANLRVEYRVGDMVAPALPNREALATVVEQFHAYVSQGKQPSADGAAGRRIVAILEAARRSLASGGERTTIDDASVPTRIRRRA